MVAAVSAALSLPSAAATLAACTPVRVVISHARPGTGLVVAVEDAWGRRSERVVSDALTAAALVESWVRTDMSAPLLIARSAPFSPASPPSVEAPSAPDAGAGARAAGTEPSRTSRGATMSVVDDEVPFGLRRDAAGRARPGADLSTATSVTPPRGAPRGLRGSVAFATELAASTDRSAWIGTSLAGCVRLGPTCAGALIRFGHDARPPDHGGDSETHRLAGDLLLALDFPFALGSRFRLTPGVALGVGFMHSSRHVEPGGPEGEVDSGGLRGEARLVVSISLTRILALDLGLSASASLPAHTESFQDGDVALAGEPRAFVRTGIGLRLGSP